MSATMTYTGTWTPLSTDLTNYRPNQPGSVANVPTALSLNRADLATIPEEVVRLIELIQDGYGTLPLTAGNVRLSFWPAAVLLRTWLTALFDAQTAANPSGMPGVLRATGVANA